MPDLLVELLSEEIPARMQARAADDLRKLVTDRLVAAGLVYEGAAAYATPRRLALAVQGIPVQQPDVKEERKGPRVGAPEGAIAGFLKSAGLTSLDEARIEKDPKKGEFYVAVIEKRGRPAIDVIAEIVPEVVRGFPWPKSMRWGAGDLNWVRPLHSIVATFGPETEEPEIVRFAVDGVAAGDLTRGHRFLAPAPIRVRRLDDYVAKLTQAKVMLDPARRAEMILTDAKNLAFAQGFELVEDLGLLAEVAGLVEWPVVLMGAFDQAFLAIPPEVIRTTIRNNQKCFVLRDPRTATLVNKFILVSNIEAADGGKAIVAGNERVIRARLSDAKFFYEADVKVPLQDRLSKLTEIVFHEKLGTQAERVERIERLARELAPHVGADPAKAARAARLAKADLVTEMVGEFPELQGLMGRYYAATQGEDASVARAIEEHYKPLGPSDRVPTDPVSVAVALADKLDTLVGFWAIDERPTGSRDPYGLRRSALGIIRLILTNNSRIQLEPFVFAWVYEATSRIYDKLDQEAFSALEGESIVSPDVFQIAFRRLYTTTIAGSILGSVGYPEEIVLGAPSPWDEDAWDEYIEGVRWDDDQLADSLVQFRTYLFEIMKPIGFAREFRVADQYQALREIEGFDLRRAFVRSIWPELYKFLVERLKVQLREQGARHDLVDAVFALEGQDDLVLIVRRVEALGKFLDTDDGRNLLAGYKRATNIIRIEEKKDGVAYAGAPDPRLYAQDEERALAAAIAAAKADAAAAVGREDFSVAMQVISGLRPKVDAFFDKVTVNVDDRAVRANRLKLLNEIREATRAVADFSKIEG